ncbi:MAG: patatin-like phospholipase family protein [Paludibacter sp.]|nr:patatin-like phospholipase family protein [Paludibacter sp.]
MKKILLLISVSLFLCTGLSAQKVGLVLSGGGAPGIAHIGVIKALEEHNIPVDYIAGTSIGAIIGGMYAMGMSPNEMIEVIKSDDFKHWMSGEVQPEDVYFYRSADPNPGIIDIRVQINKQKTGNIKTLLLPANIVSPVQMNYAFVPLCAQANAVAGGNFDKLFVPFRCVASDVYDKKAVAFKRGVLGDAIRASMTFPFVFKPISIDNQLLFDGGIYNNFPTDVMRSDFKPDFMIGSVVAYNPPKADADDPMMQLQNMIITRTNYSIPSPEGLLLKFNLEKINMFDFTKVDELVKLGYDSVMKHLDEIKARVHQRVPFAELEQRRKEFRAKFPKLEFQHIRVEGVDSLQKQYVKRSFQNKNKEFGLNEFKQSYFRLISDEAISEVIPHAVFDSVSGLFNLNLNVKTGDKLKVNVGGNISSSISNQAYLGLTYQNLSNYAQTAYINAQFGKMYNALGLGTRIEMPSSKSWYLKLAFVLHKFDYFNGNSLFYLDNQTANFNQNEAYGKLSIGFPLATKGRLELGVGYGNLTDNYNQNNTLLNSATGNDRSTFSLGSAFCNIERYTLNDRMYPTNGFNYSTSIQLIDGKQSYNSASNSNINTTNKKDMWLQYRAKSDRYFPLSSHFCLGTYAELVYSTRNLLQTYTSTIIQAPVFQPTPYTRTVFNEAFSANQFAAIGIKPIYMFTDQLQLRAEAYWFVPYKSVLRATNNTAYYSKSFSTSQFMTESALVYNFKVASAGLFANYTIANQWVFGLNIGILLFNPKFLE